MPSLRASSSALALVLVACGEDPLAAGECPGLLADRISGASLDAHMRAFGDIAAASGGNRAADTPGFAASAEYVDATLTAAGYAVTRQRFVFHDFRVVGTPVFAETAPAAVDHAYGDEFRVATFAGDGDVRAPAYAVDLDLEPGNATTSGCDAEDWDGFPVGAVALVQRGGCTYAAKMQRAYVAQAGAVVLINQGDTEDRRGLFTPRLPVGTPFPVVSVGVPLGEALAARAETGIELRVQVDGDTFERDGENVIVETPPTASGRVVMVGGHLDSVTAGPGVNDNGSGSAAVLELALALAAKDPRCPLTHRVRFAWWGAEELGLLGSAHYVAALDDAARDAIAMYLNFDMIASPNAARFIYDGDGSAFDQAGPDGSAAIEAAFADYFAAAGLPSAETPFDGRSDYGPFIAVDIPAGGLFTGAEDLKTADEARRFGGEAEVAFDPCYHAGCDGLDNYDPALLLEHARAVAHVAATFAMPASADRDPLPRRARAAAAGPAAGFPDDLR